MKIQPHWLTAKHWLTQTLQQVLQTHCIFCQARSLSAYPCCAACHADLPWIKAHHLPSVLGSTQCLSVFAYEAPIRQLLLSVKFGKQLREVHALSQFILTGLTPQLDCLPEAILPVPLHTQRLRTRGFNQAVELIRPFAKQLRIPLLTRHVVRHKATQAQTELNFAQRQSNVQNAFQVQRTLPFRHIAIFDDVITTGATTSALASILLEDGVERVDIWSCARAMPQQSHARPPIID